LTPAAQTVVEGRVDAAKSLSLLNAFKLQCRGDEVALPMSAQRLLAFVAVHDHPLQRDYVGGTLWPDTSDDKAAANLRSTLWRLHHAGHRVIEATNTRLQLASDVRVDVREAEALARRVLDGAVDLDEVHVNDDPFTGDLLPDWYDDWVLLERERLRQLTLHALESLCERYLAAARLGEALQAALAAVAGEPLRESAHRILIRVHLAEGNACEAIRQYRFCARLLRERLGLEPSAQLAELVEKLTP
jgi:DNA-binding SARP family transcriptional activator